MSKHLKPYKKRAKGLWNGGKRYKEESNRRERQVLRMAIKQHEFSIRFHDGLHDGIGNALLGLHG